MKKWIRKCLFRYFNGQRTDLDVEIRRALNRSKELTRNIVSHYFSGGSYKSAQSTFFVAESTYYWHIDKFGKSLEKFGKL